MLIALVCLLTGLVCVSFAEGTEEETLQPVLQLKPAEMTLQKGRSAKITPSVANARKGVRTGKFEWTSSDRQVAVYQNGSIHGTGGGQAVLTCSVVLSDGTELSAECPVTVTVPVADLRVTDQTLTVMAGDVFTPEVRVLPEDASDPSVQYTVSDEEILAVGPGGQITALATGKAYLTVASTDNRSKKVKLTVTVTRRIGKTDRELAFLDLPWEGDYETCIRLLKGKGFIAQEARCPVGYTVATWYWPENDLLFSRNSAWRSQTAAGRASLDPLQTVGGYMPQVANLIFLNGIGENGQPDRDVTRLTGIYFRFDNEHGNGAVIFCELLKKLEEAYGEFDRRLSKDIPRYYPDLYKQIETAMADAKQYGLQEPGIDEHLEEYAICTMRGAGHTGIMLNMDSNGVVTLFYGRTDATEMIRELQAAFREETPGLEDAGI